MEQHSTRHLLVFNQKVCSEWTSLLKGLNDIGCFLTLCIKNKTHTILVFPQSFLFPLQHPLSFLQKSSLPQKKSAPINIFLRASVTVLKKCCDVLIIASRKYVRGIALWVLACVAPNTKWNKGKGNSAHGLPACLEVVLAALHNCWAGFILEIKRKKVGMTTNGISQRNRSAFWGKKKNVRGTRVKNIRGSSVLCL